MDQTLLLGKCMICQFILEGKNVESEYKTHIG